MMMRTLGLAFNIRLTEIRSATHLIGREGVIRGQDPADNGRLRGRLDDGTIVRQLEKLLITCTCVVGTTSACRREYISCWRRWLSNSGMIGALQLRN